MRIFHRSSPPVAVPLLAALAGLSASPGALAHGGIPRAYEILPEPGNPDHTVLRSYVWGLMHTRNGGQTWEYTCSEVWGGRATTAEHVNMTVLPGGRVLVAAGYEGLRYTDDGCNWSEHPEFDGLIVQDVRRDPRPGGALYLSTSIGRDGTIEPRLWRSGDGGDTWATVGEVPLGFAPTQIAFPQGESPVLYQSGGWVEGGSVLMRSEDRGETWTRHDLPLTPEDGDTRAVLVHPGDPDVVIVWADRSEAFLRDEPDKLLVTTDGGSTWRVMFQGTADLPGLAISPDGTKIYVGGSRDGIHEADLARAIEEGPAAFQQVYQYPVWALRFDGDRLRIGGNNFGPKGEPEYTLGTSTDPGRTESVDMTVCDLGFTACGADTTVGRLCPDLWSAPEQQGLHSDYIEPRCRPDAGDGPDGGAIATGAVSEAPRAAAGGGCSVGGPGSGGTAGFAAGLLALLVAGRRRRPA